MEKSKIKKKYPYTFVKFIKNGKAEVYFNENEHVLYDLFEEIIKPLLIELNIDEEIVDKEVIYNLMAKQFSNNRNNVNDYYYFLTLNGDFVKKQNIEGAGGYNKQNEYKCKSFTGINTKQKIETFIKDLNEKIDNIRINLKTYFLTVNQNLITQEDCDEFNK